MRAASAAQKSRRQRFANRNFVSVTPQTHVQGYDLEHRKLAICWIVPCDRTNCSLEMNAYQVSVSLHPRGTFLQCC